MNAKVSQSLFGQRLREARLRSGLPQDKLGVEIGLDESVASARISRYETGVHAPPYETAVRLAQVLGIPPAYFYCDEEDLAALILAWGQLSKAGKNRLKKALTE